MKFCLRTIIIALNIGGWLIWRISYLECLAGTKFGGVARPPSWSSHIYNLAGINVGTSTLNCQFAKIILCLFTGWEIVVVLKTY